MGLALERGGVMPALPGGPRGPGFESTAEKEESKPKEENKTGAELTDYALDGSWL